MKLITYSILLPCIPYPYQGQAIAGNLKAAIGKIRWQVKQLGLKPAYNGAIGVISEILAEREV